MSRLRQFGALAALVGSVLACGGPAAPDASVNARATGLALTAQFVLTATAVAGITPVTPTSVPTFTAVPLPTTTQAPPPAASPTATVPAPADASPTPCANNDSAFVSDVNVPDGTHFAAGTVFNKTWRLRNDGDCTWTTAYQFRYVSGDALGGATVNLTAPVPPGATTDITVAFTAPTTNGTYTSNWQLFSPAGTAFGTKPFVKIIVP